MMLVRFFVVTGVVGILGASCGGTTDPKSDQKLDSAVYLDSSVPADLGLIVDQPVDQASPLADGAVDLPVDVPSTVEVDAGGDAQPTAADAADVSAAADAVADAEADATPDAVEMCGKLRCDCTFEGKDLRGNMAYVDGFPYHVSVYVVQNGLADLFVQDVPRPGLTSKCGQWQPDALVPVFRVRKVTSPAFADFTIQYVKAAEPPGLPGRRF